MRTIYIDESGYSGSNFTDNDKPLFVVASLAVEPEEAERLKEQFFSSVNSAELKHSKLVGRQSQQRMVLDFLSEVALRPEIAKFWLAEKRFAGWLKVVEHLTEPAMARQGFDAYKNGFHIGFASVLARCLPVFASPEKADALLTAAISTLKRCSQAERQVVVDLAKSIAADHPQASTLINSAITFPLLSLPDEMFTEMDSGAADMAFGAVLQLLGWWRTDLAEPFRVVHDATANVVRRKEVLDALVGDSIDPFFQKASSGMSVTLPIGATTVFEKSEGHAGLQLADVLAGALGCSLDRSRGGERGEYAERVIERLDGLQLHALVAASTPTPEGMGTDGTNMNPLLDHLGAQFAAGKVPMPRRHGPPRKP